MIQRAKILILIAGTFCVTVQNPLAQTQHPRGIAVKKIDDAVLRNATATAGDWLTHGRDYSETRFSPLKEINTSNVKSLGLAWSFDTETTRGLEATPIAIDGILYTTGSWSIVFALDARTGKLLWKWDPQVPRTFGQKACCD